MMDLGQYLKAALTREWNPGEWDCAFFPGEWANGWGLGDPLAEWRGAYQTDRGGLRLVRRAGGLEGLWSRALLSIGVAAVDKPIAGDVGVVQVLNYAGHPEHVGGIFTGDRWAMCAPKGLVFGPADALGVWGPR